MKKFASLLVLTSLLFGVLLTNSCKKEVTLPVLTTTNITAVTINSATGGGNITSSGGGDITARGVCWGTSHSPAIAGDHTSDGKGSGSFASSITGLTPNTQYYVRAYATNSAGTAYGSEVTFTTSEIVVPTLTTTTATALGLTTATSGGNITADGGAPVTARGVVWATTAGPTIDNSKTSDGTGTGEFSSSITGLTPSTTYYYRAYATNSAGTAYGTELSLTTLAIAVPTVTTAEATNITLTTAISGGNVTADGGASVSARGICWSTSHNPTTADSKTTNGTGTGTFASDLTGLTPGATYYVRAYATNSVGTAYGNEVTFVTTPVAIATLTTTAASAVTYTAATTGGNITDAGGGTVTARGVCYSTTSGPTIADPKTSDGTGIGTFTSSLTGLTAGTTYYAKAYATNSAGTAYGEEITFSTPAVVVPTLATAAATSVTQTGATTGGTITDAGGGTITARGVAYSTTATPTIAGTHTTDGTGTGSFVSTLTTLTPGMTYHVRAYATNSAGTGYGDELTFVTSAILDPTVTSTAATAITQTGATAGGNVTADGGATVTARGIVYALTADPTLSNTVVAGGTGTGIFTADLTGLTPGTIYHFRAYATNSAGTAYGADLTFTTSPVVLATLTTTAATAITINSANSGGNITDAGGGTITARGVCYATTTNPTTSNSVVADGTPGIGTFASSLTGLAQGTQYYVRAYATNSAGTAYGAQIILNTNLADVDGNSYKTVTIGTQVWMAENLKTTHYSDNTVIPLVTDNAAWAALLTPAYSFYANDEGTNKPLYGALYNWWAANSDNICPTGWHAPAESEFTTLELALGMDPAVTPTWDFRGTDQGTQMKNQTGWPAGQNGTNTSGFSALPGGYRYNIDGTFNLVGTMTYFWAADELDAARGWYRRLDGAQTGVNKGATEKPAGKYIRCVKD
jgi:uncharacterized protein (TIGR02145 family)